MILLQLPCNVSVNHQQSFAQSPQCSLDEVLELHVAKQWKCLSFTKKKKSYFCKTSILNCQEYS